MSFAVREGSRHDANVFWVGDGLVAVCCATSVAISSLLMVVAMLVLTSTANSDK